MRISILTILKMLIISYYNMIIYMIIYTICTYNMITCIVSVTCNITHILQINNNFLHSILKFILFLIFLLIFFIRKMNNYN